MANSFIGKKATPELGEEMLAATGAKTLRWVPPRSAVTMDFRPDRLTVSYDDDYVITQASCT
ncbi:I78 family peptidase inhibitor [Croceibacterium salegens]|uniref:I78 family peptidase inhibitor n=1 Tax=Croceibacterium salegens TaxID=1737568 RepID=UPI002E27575A